MNCERDAEAGRRPPRVSDTTPDSLPRQYRTGCSQDVPTRGAPVSEDARGDRDADGYEDDSAQEFAAALDAFTESGTHLEPDK